MTAQGVIVIEQSRPNYQGLTFDDIPAFCKQSYAGDYVGDGGDAMCTECGGAKC